jgi:hypothetical protein
VPYLQHKIRNVHAKDVHETFQPETETKTFSPETETRPRHCQTIPRRERDHPRPVDMRPRRDVGTSRDRLETRHIRDRDRIYDTYYEYK